MYQIEYSTNCRFSAPPVYLRWNCLHKISTYSQALHTGRFPWSSMDLLFTPVNNKCSHELILISLFSSHLSPYHNIQLISALPKTSSCLTILLRPCFSSFSFVAFPHCIKSFCLEIHTSREATGRQSKTIAMAKSLTKNPPI